MLCAMLMGFVIPAYAGIQIQTWMTKNGAKVLFVENHALPIIDISVEFDAGSRRDPAGKAGVSALTNLLMDKGIAFSADAHEQAMTETQISDAFADTGALHEKRVTADRAGIILRTLSSLEESRAAIHILARMLSQPTFPSGPFERDRARAVSSVREELTQPDAIARRAFMQALYGEHPYAASAVPESLEAVSRDDLIHFHRMYYVSDRAVITIVGDVHRARAEEIATSLSAGLYRADKEKALKEFPQIMAQPGKEKRIAHPATQSHIWIGMPAARRNDPDFFPLMVGNYILGGGGFVSRLMQEVREKRGLSYSVHSSFKPMLQEGPFQIGLQTKRAQTEEAVRVARETLTNFLQTGVTQKELEAAKDYLVESFALRTDTNRKIRELVAAIGYFDLPLDYLDTWTGKVQKVTRDDIHQAFKRKVFVERLNTIIVGEMDN